MKRKKQRVVGRSPQVRQSVGIKSQAKQPASTAEPVKIESQEAKAPDKVQWKAEYVFQQYYEITIDEDQLEADEEDLERFKRMLKSLVTNSKALHAVCEFLVYRELEDGDSYCSEYYGDYNKSLDDILEEHTGCFALEDRDMLSSLADVLRDVIQLEPSGFVVGQHAHQHESNS